MTIPDSTVAIIGTGNIGGTLAANFAAGGQDFLLAGRDLEAARKLADTLDGHAEAVTVDEAVARADVLVLAVWLDSSRQLIAQYGERLAGKVIVDPSNPVGPDGEGGYRKVIGEQESSGQILARLLPAGARLVKAFGTLSAPTLAAATRQEPERAVQFYAADDAAAGDLVADLIRADGYEPVRGVELHRTLGLLPCGCGQRGGRQRAECLDQPCSGRQQPGQDLARGFLLADDLVVAALAVRFDRVRRVDDHLAGEPLAVLGDDLLEGVEPEGEHEHVGPVDRLVDAHHFGVAVEVGRDLRRGVLVAPGQQEVLTAGREVRREPAADVAGADDGNGAVRNSHLGPPSVTWFPQWPT